MKRSLLLAVALLVAMSVGRVVTDTVPLADVDSDPFHVHGHVGQTLRLRYADLTVDDVRSAANLGSGSQRVKPSGRFLVVDVTLVGHGRPQHVGYTQISAGGRLYSSTTRGGCATPFQSLPTGLRWHVQYCFDVPRSGLAGAVLEVSQGVPGMDGERDRDDVADVDLGIGKARAAYLWRTTTGYEGFNGGFEKPRLEPLPPVKGQS